MAVADHIVDLGPRAGANGGQIMYEGGLDGLRDSDTLTGAFLSRRPVLKTGPRTPTGKLRVEHATLHNLRDVTIDVPLGVLTAVTGVAGSGKSSLIHGVLIDQHPEIIAIDQSAIRTSTRSTASTYLGIMDPIRKRFAKANKVKPGLFSFNSDGACEECKGLGLIYTDLAFLDPVQTPCQRCGGKRFKDEVLQLTLDGRSISDVLDLTAAQALEVFDAKDINPRLQAMVDVGLAYLTLGQSLSTLSGGECQRLKLADDLHRQGSIYVLDEPTTGLHMADVGTLLRLMDRLVDEGSSVIVIEHNLDVIAVADWIIDLGPEGGDRGGQVVFTGTATELAAAEGSLTGEHLRREVGV
jgi:excinuclease UvrABC ATPase subunit